jgi:hypothetical protein
VATYASRLFPKLAAAFITKVKNEGLLPASQFERGPYPNDVVTYPASGVARFVTPANTTGLGTDGMLAPTTDVIRGVAVLDMSGDWGITVLRVRLQPEMHDVEDAIMQLNERCVRNPYGR